MSRCLPFPPPGYARNGVSGEALLQRIKVRGEESKAERKRKKEERRRKRMEELEEGEILQKKSRRSKKGEKTSEIECETQELGRSCTEDLRQPMFVCSNDSYGHRQSIRRKDHSWYGYGWNNHNQGCTTWVDLPMFPASIHSNGSMQQIESQFGEYCIPAPLQFPDFEFDNQGWPSRAKQPNDMNGTSNAWSYDLCHGNSTLYPHAMYFPHADTYAYPYGMPY